MVAARVAVTVNTRPLRMVAGSKEMSPHRDTVGGKAQGGACSGPQASK
jgi:hypothetical protein